MNKTNKIEAFTLIELIIVISIMAGLLLFSFPVFRSFTPKNDSGVQLNKFVDIIETLKVRALKDRKDYFLYLDTLSGKAFVSQNKVYEPFSDNNLEEIFSFPEGLRILDVQFPGLDPTDSHLYRISFRRDEYSDFALIHLEKNNNPITLRLEPFLSSVILQESYFKIENCK